MSTESRKKTTLTKWAIQKKKKVKKEEKKATVQEYARVFFPLFYRYFTTAGGAGRAPAPPDGGAGRGCGGFRSGYCYCWQAQDFLRESVGSVGAIVIGMLSRDGEGSLSPSLRICFCDTMW